MHRGLRLAVVLVGAATAAASQFDRPARRHQTDLAYDGQFTLVRLRWKSDFGFSGRGFSAAWNHDYPLAEQNLSLIVRELTAIGIHTDGAHTLATLVGYGSQGSLGSSRFFRFAVRTREPREP